MPLKLLKVNCPTCSILIEWTDKNKYRPFCSERCKLIDFGEWANESNAIPATSLDEEELNTLDELIYSKHQDEFN